jgi:hypothetical protein
LRVSDEKLRFPEVEIRFVFASRPQIELIVAESGAVEELRRASDTPTFFTTTVRREQDAWVEDLVRRVSGPDAGAPAVCLLDGGIAQLHPLLAPALAPQDCLTVDPAWGINDSDPGGHGTNMAGSVLYRDLPYPLADTSDIELAFKLESVSTLHAEMYMLPILLGVGVR